MLTVVGVAANVLGVVTAVQSVLRRDALLIVLTLTAVLLLGGFWFWYQRTRLAVALLALGCVLLGGVVATQLGRPSTPPPPAAGTSTPTPSASGDASPPSTAVAATVGSSAPPTTPPANGVDPDAPRVLVDRDVVLPRAAAIDVDQPGQQVVAKHAGGATDGLDLYHDWADIRSDNIQVANPPNVYQYSGGDPSRAYQTCAQGGSGSARASFTPGADFCFRTSEGRVGFATIAPPGRDQVFVVHVVVWDATGA
ncbi:hypothetical protein ACGFIW_17380 [Micromonospora sp. NPDC048935]|uniref:hypothetical protein n=1 Tax=Micromonospora sp. NPDC048935 TaxID=3364262 RepID=UPI00371F4878